MKSSIDQLAYFSATPSFQTIKPVSNLAQPCFEVFTHYLSIAQQRHQWTQHGFLNRMLEQRLAEFHQVRFCVSYASGFWALASLMRTLALPGKTQVIMPSLTYRRMADIAAWADLTPHFCDVDRIEMTNTAALVAPHINENTALIMGVHPVNGLADIEALQALSQQHHIPLVFDSVESVYESRHGQRIGGFGDAEIFSLGASKLINGFEGGYMTTQSEEIYQKCRQAQTQINADLSEVHAAMALAGLDDIDQQISRNRARYLAYQKILSPISQISLLAFDLDHRPGYKNIMIRVNDASVLSRDDIVSLLNAERVLARAYYPQPLHQKKTSYAQICPPLANTEALCQELILLPCGEQVSLSDIEQIGQLLAFIYANAPAIQSRMKAAA